jgi:hypothetical protein
MNKEQKELLGRLAAQTLSKSDTNIMSKVNAGGTLTQSERARMEELKEGSGTGEGEAGEDKWAGRYLSKKIELAAALDITRPTVDDYLAKGIIPPPSPGQGWSVDECRRMVALAKKGGKASSVMHIEADHQEVERGAEFALERINEDEARCYANYQQAIASGDPATIKFYRALWREAAADQRAQEEAIEDDRRAIGELMPQAVAEKFFYEAGGAFLRSKDTAIKRAASEAVGIEDERDIAQAIFPPFAQAILSALDQAVRASRIPSWALASLKQGLQLR